MNRKLISSCLLLVVLVLVDKAHGQMQCYVCEGCPDPFEGTAQQRQPCPDPATTPPPGAETTTLILTPPPLPGETTAETTETPPTPPIITPPTIPGRRRREAATSFASTHRCYRIEHNNIVRRGCVAYFNSQADTCMSVNGGVQPADCRLCDWDGCNSASGLRVSLFAMLIAALLATFLRT
ncbi:hypothetical protein AND_009546 [Anopheles darlingi]|uniref:Uncharacterized protein n=1 Tax=Anopheles darlingi TaxID=43151 RepID=W5J4N1_ANODA|nr:hypothetical protein AND_009546 [Anopheles darlingi]